MKIRNINPQGDVQVAALNFQLVKRGEVVEVSEEVAALLLIQTVNWELPDKAPKADQEFTAKVIAEHLDALIEGSRQFAEPEPVEAIVSEPTPISIETPGEGDVA